MSFLDHITRQNDRQGSLEKKFWLNALKVYIIAEAIFALVTWVITYVKCRDCLQPLLFYIYTFLFGILATIGLWAGLRSLQGKQLGKVILGNLLLFIVYYFSIISFIYFLINTHAGWAIYPLKEGSYDSVIYSSWREIGKYVVKLSSFYMLIFYFDYRETSRQRLQLAVTNKDLQLNLLKQQLSPHFYFNTLNNLYGLSRNDNSNLPTALHQLSNIMQYVITDCNSQRVLLQQEIAFLRSYIELEKLRYEPGTVIEFAVKGEARDQQIVPLLLIQFVENAFKHGMKEKSRNNWMETGMIIENNILFFTVKNSYYDEVPTGGIGISSVRNILQLQYPNRYVLNMEQEGHCFSVTLKLEL